MQSFRENIIIAFVYILSQCINFVQHVNAEASAHNTS